MIELYIAKLVENDILHLIIGLLVKNLFFLKWPLAAILDLCYFIPLTSKIIGNIKMTPGTDLPCRKP